MDVITQALLMGSAGGGAARDPYFPNTTLLLHGDGTNGAQNNTFVDGSTNNFTITRNGNTTQGSFSPYGDNWSNYFDGNGDYLSLSTQAVLNVGTGNFTVECFLFFPAVSRTYSRAMVFGPTEATFSTGLQIRLIGATQGAGGIDIILNNTTVISYTTAVAANTWNHIALVREGTGSNQLKLYINGTNVASGTTAASLGTPSYNIGRLQANNATFDDYYEGYISNLRIVTSAVYTANFTPSTTPLTAITNTSLLTCQSNRFRDNSTNAFAITRNGDVSVQRFSPFAPSAAYSATSFDDAASQYFDGSGDYLTVPNGSAFTFGTGDFAVEAWVYLTATPATNYTQIVGCQEYGLTGSFILAVDTNLNIRAYIQSSASTASDIAGGTCTRNSWNHAMMCRTGTTLSLYLNGSRVATTTTNIDVNHAPYVVSIGADQNGDEAVFTGYISNVRVIKGAHPYDATQSTITVPTTPLTAVTNTSLLTCQNYTVRDNSTNNFAITVNGNTRGDRLVPFGNNWSNYFDGSGDYLTVPAGSAFAYGTGDFTVEGWFFMTAAPPTFGATLFSQTVSGTNYVWINITETAPYTVNFAFAVSGGGTSVGGPSGAVSLNKWVHFAVVRSGTTATVYVNGVAGTPVTCSQDFTNTTYVPTIGRYTHTTTNHFTGYISNLRILKGTALYTAAFTPPSAPLTAITNTSLLTCQSNRFVDNSTNAFTITRNGDVTVENENPFPAPTPAVTSTIGGSGYFDGTSDYLTLASNSAFALGTGDFTIEFWLYLRESKNGYQFLNINSNGALGTIILGTNNSAQLEYYNNATRINDSTAVPLYQWTHVALCRSSGTSRLFKNGTQVGSSYADSINCTSTGTFLIGTRDDNLAFAVNGYISDFRLLKGTAQYTAAFTPPTAPLTAVTNTSLLCNFTNAGIYDNAMMNDLETVGNAQISTTQKKYGTGALYFDGTGDYLKHPTSVQFGFGTGDFTIEAWIYPTTSGTDRAIADFRTGSGANGTFYLNTSNKLAWYGGSATGGTGTAVTQNAWNHVALSRSGGTTRAYLDGVEQWNSATLGTGTLPSTAPLGIGAAPYDGTSPFTGYIDDLRITKGVARYTANFTPPTAALPDY